MNVTLKLPDDVCRAARHRAVDESKSLSAWLADLVRRELTVKTSIESKSLIEMIGDTEYRDRDLPLLDRKASPHREIPFP